MNIDQNSHIHLENFDWKSKIDNVKWKFSNREGLARCRLISEMDIPAVYYSVYCVCAWSSLFLLFDLCAQRSFFPHFLFHRMAFNFCIAITCRVCLYALKCTNSFIQLNKFSCFGLVLIVMQLFMCSLIISNVSSYYCYRWELFSQTH